jgi:hypothetical protein
LVAKRENLPSDLHWAVGEIDRLRDALVKAQIRENKLLERLDHIRQVGRLAEAQALRRIG